MGNGKLFLKVVGKAALAGLFAFALIRLILM
jgi:hypothetical protein